MTALRVRPAIPTNLQRETPPEGMMIAGRFVPGGVTSVNGFSNCRPW
jgi:hypothetical protein